MNDSSFSRLVSVLFAPAKTFASIAERPTWLVGVLLFTILGMGSSFLFVPKVDWAASARQQIEDSGRADNLSAEQIEQQVAIIEKFSSVSIYVVTVIGPWLIYPLIALVFFGLFKIFGSEIGFKQSLSVLVHGFMPFMVAGLLTIPVILGRAEISGEELQQGSLLASNAGVLLPEDASPTMMALAVSLDVFTIWAVVLLVIGYSVVARVSRGKAIAVVVGSWVVWIVIKVGLAGLGQAFGG